MAIHPYVEPAGQGADDESSDTAVADCILADHEIAVLYKHSPTCFASARAAREIHRFAEANPNIPVYWLDVLVDRALSQTLAARFDIPHESPQVILLSRGQPIWEASHRGVRAKSVADQIEVTREANSGP